MTKTPHPFLAATPWAPPGPARRIDPLALAVVVAVLLDAAFPLPNPTAFWSCHWLDIAALAALAAAWLTPGADRSRGAWATPYDLAIAGGLALSALSVIPPSAPSQAVLWLRQVITCAAIFYVAAYRARRAERARTALWSGFGVAAAALGAHAAWAATSGPLNLAQQSALADRYWGAHHGLAKTLVFASAISLGRTFSRTSSPWWRVAALLGFGGLALHGLAGGLGLEARALGRISEPLYFCTLAVTVLLLLSLGREAWRIGVACDDRRPSWIALAFAFAGVSLFGMFGGITGGAGLHALVAIAAGITVGGRDVQSRGERVEAVDLESELPHAA